MYISATTKRLTSHSRKNTWCMFTLESLRAKLVVNVVKFWCLYFIFFVSIVTRCYQWWDFSLPRPQFSCSGIFSVHAQTHTLWLTHTLDRTISLSLLNLCVLHIVFMFRLFTNTGFAQLRANELFVNLTRLDMYFILKITQMQTTVIIIAIMHT